jgi:hypothetical protein
MLGALGPLPDDALRNPKPGPRPIPARGPRNTFSGHSLGVLHNRAVSITYYSHYTIVDRRQPLSGCYAVQIGRQYTKIRSPVPILIFDLSHRTLIQTNVL